MENQRPDIEQKADGLESVDSSTEIKALQEEIKKSIQRIAFVDVDHLAESEARDVAETRLTEERDGTKGVKNILKRIWKYNIAKEYYRQNEISKVKEEIYSSGNIYAGDETTKSPHEQAMNSVTDRFLSQYEGVIRENSDEIKSKLDKIPAGDELELKHDIFKLIKEYARGTFDTDKGFNEEAYEEERNRVLTKVKKYGGEAVGGGKLYADNLKQIGEQVRNVVNHGKGIENLDKLFADIVGATDLDITVGKAQSSVRTEANYNKIDKIINKVNSSLGGTVFANETTIASGIAIATSLLTSGTRSVARTTGKLFGFFGGVVVSGAISGMKENTRLKMERAQHLRDVAKGRTIGKDDSPRREMMGDYVYDIKTANQLQDDLLNTLYIDGDSSKELLPLTDEQIKKSVGVIAEIEARINLSNTKKIDLISFSHRNTVEVERANLEIALAEAKARFKEKMKNTESTDSENLDSLIGKSTRVNEELSKNIDEMDRAFQKMKRREVGKAAAKGMLSSVVVGGAIHEVMAFGQDDTLGIAERLIKGDAPKALDATPLEKIRELLFGGGHSAAEDGLHTPLAEVEWNHPGEHIRFPEGTSLHENADHTVTIVSGGKTVADHIKFEFNPDGTPTAETLNDLNAAGIVPGEVGHHLISGVTDGSVPPDQYIAGHGDAVEVKRDLWFDNNTKAPIFEKNELGISWGGEHGTGIDAEGKNYVFNVSQMTDAGSVHGELSAHAKTLAEQGKLTMRFSLSKGTQNHVFSIPVDTDGNIKVSVDSELGKILFDQQSGHAVFEGQYAEVVESVGVDPSGVDHVHVISTVVGHGVDSVPTTVPTSINEVTHNFSFKDTTTTPRGIAVPPAIPLVGRRPLEPMKEGTPAVIRKKKETKKDSEQTDTAASVVDKKQDTSSENGGDENISPSESEPVDEKAAPVDDQEQTSSQDTEGPNETITDIPFEEVPDKEKNEDVKTKEPQKTNFVEQKEYDALKKDLDFINKKIQASEGIITVSYKDLSSAHARTRYFNMEHIPEGKDITFNRSELMTIGDELEHLLSSARIPKKANEFARMMLELGLTQKEKQELRSDIDSVNKWVREGRHIFTVGPEELKSVYAQKRVDEMIQEEKEKPAQYKGELDVLGTEIENLLQGKRPVDSSKNDEVVDSTENTPVQKQQDTDSSTEATPADNGSEIEEAQIDDDDSVEENIQEQPSVSSQESSVQEPKYEKKVYFKKYEDDKIVDQKEQSTGEQKFELLIESNGATASIKVPADALTFWGSEWRVFMNGVVEPNNYPINDQSKIEMVEYGKAELKDGKWVIVKPAKIRFIN